MSCILFWASFCLSIGVHSQKLRGVIDYSGWYLLAPHTLLPVEEDKSIWVLSNVTLALFWLQSYQGLKCSVRDLEEWRQTLSGVPFGSNNTGINSRSLPLGLHKITPTVVFPWLDKFSFSELEGTSIQQRHPFLYLRSLLAALVPLDFPSDTDGGGGQQCLLSLGSDPMRLIFMLLSMF